MSNVIKISLTSTYKNVIRAKFFSLLVFFVSSCFSNNVMFDTTSFLNSNEKIIRSEKLQSLYFILFYFFFVSKNLAPTRNENQNLLKSNSKNDKHRQTNHIYLPVFNCTHYHFNLKIKTAGFNFNPDQTVFFVFVFILIFIPILIFIFFN